jgi:diaminopimelate decarboxylase
MKASNVAVLQLLKEMGSGLDTVSIHRTSCGYEPEKIFIHQMAYLLKKLKSKCNGRSNKY